MKQIKYWGFHIIFFTSMYAGYVLDIEGMKNIALFLAWFSIVASFFLLDKVASFFLLDKAVAVNLSKAGREVPRQINVTLDIVMMLTLVYFGCIFTAIFFVIHSIIIDTTFQITEKDVANEV